jgi:hypothetical protein
MKASLDLRKVVIPLLHLDKVCSWVRQRQHYQQIVILHVESEEATDLYLPNPVRFRMVAPSLAGLNARKEFIIRAVSGNPALRGCGLNNAVLLHLRSARSTKYY